MLVRLRRLGAGRRASRAAPPVFGRAVRALRRVGWAIPGASEFRAPATGTRNPCVPSVAVGSGSGPYRAAKSGARRSALAITLLLTAKLVDWPKGGFRRRSRVGRVNGNRHQIDRIHAEAEACGITVTVLVDWIHVSEYLWSAAWRLGDNLYDDMAPVAGAIAAFSPGHTGRVMSSGQFRPSPAKVTRRRGAGAPAPACTLGAAEGCGRQARMRTTSSMGAARSGLVPPAGSSGRASASTVATVTSDLENSEHRTSTHTPRYRRRMRTEDPGRRRATQRLTRPRMERATSA